jgi:hypothetical protein
MNDPSPMSAPQTFADTRSVTGLPGLGDGHTHFGSPGGRMTSQCGPGRARASRSRSAVNKLEKATAATCGRNGIVSLSSAILQSSLESKLLARLQKYGSPECDLTWSNVSIGSGPSIFVVRASLRLTTDPVTFLWPTPQSRDHFPPHKPRYVAEKRAQGHGMSNLNDCVSLLLWPTPTAITDSGGAALCKWGGTRSRELLRGAVGNTVLNGALNPAFPLWLMGYPTEWGSCADLVIPSSRNSRRNS